MTDIFETFEKVEARSNFIIPTCVCTRTSENFILRVVLLFPRENKKVEKHRLTGSVQVRKERKDSSSGLPTDPIIQRVYRTTIECFLDVEKEICGRVGRAARKSVVRTKWKVIREERTSSCSWEETGKDNLSHAINSIRSRKRVTSVT